MTMTNLLRLAVSETGARTPSSVLRKLESVLNTFHTARWMRENGYTPQLRVPEREDVIKSVAAKIAGEEVLYLEFGVWKGESIKLWSGLLQNPASRLHGFDSFEGLPENWQRQSGKGLWRTKGYFSTDGIVPEVSDPRVKFYQGWFEDTLPAYEFIDSRAVVIFLDADLYSSTIFVLKTLKPYIKVGTILYFDEFWDPQQEQRAFREFVAETNIKLELIVADYGFNHVAFRRVQ